MWNEKERERERGDKRIRQGRIGVGKLGREVLRLETRCEWEGRMDWKALSAFLPVLGVVRLLFPGQSFAIRLCDCMYYCTRIS